MAEHSNIARVVDYTCLVAASIDGVVAIAGAGQDFYDDPFRPGYKILAHADRAKVAGLHVTNLPEAPALRWLTQDGIVELTWHLPMRFYLDGNDPISTRMQVLPMYDRYLRAFIREHTLGDLVLRTQLTSFKMGEDSDWAWLQVELLAVEQVNYSVD